MTENNEKLIASFFEDSKHQMLPDNGFTNRVMNRLPEHRYTRMLCLNRLWTAVCVVAGVLLFFMNDGFGLLKNIASDAFMDIISICVSANINIGALIAIVLILISVTYVAIYDIITSGKYMESLR